MGDFRIILCVLILAATAACRGAPPAASVYPPTLATPQPTYSIQTPNVPTQIVNDTSDTPLTLSEGETATPVPTFSAISLPSQLSPTPSSPPPVSPENASALGIIKQHAFGPWDHVLTMAWSPDGKKLAVVAGDFIHIFETATLQETMLIEPGVATPGLAFSPDGNRLAAGGRDGMLHVWDVSQGQPILELQAHQKSISSLAFSPDGSLLASAGYDAVARLWDASNADNLGEMIGGTFAIPAIAFTPDGNSLAIVNGDVIRLRDVATQRFIRTLVGEAPFYDIAFSPDGRYLASGDVANTIRIWDLTAEPGPGAEDRTSLLTLSGHDGRVNTPEALVWQVTYSPDGGTLASAGGDGTVRLWEAATGQLLATLSEHGKSVTSVAFSPDGRWLATGGLDSTIILWGVDPANTGP